MKVDEHLPGAKRMPLQLMREDGPGEIFCLATAVGRSKTPCCQVKQRTSHHCSLTAWLCGNEPTARMPRVTCSRTDGRPRRVRIELGRVTGLAKQLPFERA